ncbi:MAG: rhamnosidase, partial [Verrucomicrobia bacterium]|nr:rhamnosidase [Verrucomicrobiota bacterium]
MNRLTKNIAVLLFTLASAGQLTAAVTAGHLRVEHLENPQGIDTAQPRLSWQLAASERDVKQGAYQILVASSEAKLKAGTGNLWDSGKVGSDESVLVPYTGKPLVSRDACFWKVRVWDAKGKASAWSEPAEWTMGVLNPADWNAKLIGRDGVDETNILSGTSWIWFPEGEP